MTYEESENFKSTLWTAAGILGALIVTGVLFTAIVADHGPKSYYLENGTSSDLTTCVFEEVNWYPDPKVFCTADPGQAFVFVHNANLLLHPPQQHPPMQF
jgi:hypothetical protein